MLASDENANEDENSALLALQNEVEFYRQNQTVVEEEIRTLINDNQKLSQQVGGLLKEKLDANRRTLEHEPYREVAELKKQFCLLNKERDSLHVLWQTSQKTIEALETELKTYHGYESNGNQEIESRKDLELKTETALNDYIEVEKKYKEIKEVNNKLERDIKNKDTEINSFKDKCLEYEKLIENLKEDRTLLAAEKKCSEELRNQLSLVQKDIINYVKKEAEAKSKVAEALQLYDLVTGQRDEAFKKIAEMTDEISKLKRQLDKIKEEMSSQNKLELEEARERYNEKVGDMLAHLQNLDAELVEKGLLLNKTLRENKILQSTNDEHTKQQKDSLSTIDPKLALAEQRLEAMFNELVASERRNIQLMSEKQCLIMDIQRLEDTCNRQNKRRDWEEGLLKAENSELRLQIENLQKSLEETNEMINKLQSILSTKNELNEKMCSSKEKELVELNQHLQNQMDLNKKWKESYIDMTEKLKKRFKELEKENKLLRKKIKGASRPPSEVGSSSPHSTVS